jgi:hypothetical protein
MTRTGRILFTHLSSATPMLPAEGATAPGTADIRGAILRSHYQARAHEKSLSGPAQVDEIFVGSSVKNYQFE